MLNKQSGKRKYTHNICIWGNMLYCVYLRHLVINTFSLTGTMSGGGRSVCKGRMGSKILSDVDTKDLSNNESKLKKVSFTRLKISHCINATLYVAVLDYY